MLSYTMGVCHGSGMLVPTWPGALRASVESTLSAVTFVTFRTATDQLEKPGDSA